MDTHAIYEGAMRLLAAKLAAGDGIEESDMDWVVDIAFKVFRRTVASTATTRREVAAA